MKTPILREKKFPAPKWLWPAVVIITLGLLCSLPLLTGCSQLNGNANVGYSDAGAVNAAANVEVTSNVLVGIQGDYNLDTGDWNALLVVTFKDAPPAEVALAAQKIGAQQTSKADAPVYVLRYDSTNRDHRWFSQICREHGAVITGVQ